MNGRKPNAPPDGGEAHINFRKDGDPPEDPTMKLRGVLKNEDIVTRDLALAMAEMIFRKEFGEEDLKAQRPLIAKETPKTWIVEGSCTEGRQMDPPFEQSWTGEAAIEIVKRNCQVIKLGHAMWFTPPKGFKLPKGFKPSKGLTPPED